MQLDQARQEPAQRLAAAGGRDQQRVAALPREIEHLGLMAPQLPAAGGEPGCKRIGQCLGGSQSRTRAQASG